MQTNSGQRVMLAGSLLQLAALFTPAVQVPVSGAMAFYRIEHGAGVAFIVIALATLLVALRPRGTWRWVPALFSLILTAATYWQIRTAPSGTFLDPVVRRAVHAGWGFIPMIAAILLGLVGAALVKSESDPAARLMR